MDNTKIVYKTFTKFVISLVVNNGIDLEVAKKLVFSKFENHANKELISEVIDQTQLGDESLMALSHKCIAIFEEIGPNRNYISLVFILDEIFDENLTINEEDEKILEDFHQEIYRLNAAIESPPVVNMLLESRSLLEWTSMLLIYPFIPKHKNTKNRPVLLMPPYLGNDYSTAFVRQYLRSIGFKTYKWELGVNMINSNYLPKLIERLDEIFERHQEKVSLVGWSGGGIFAKIIANRYPEKVEQLITIGSPVWGLNEMETPLLRIMEFLRGKRLKERNKKFLLELEEIPKVPITCIYTKTDGLIPWKHCMEAEYLRDDIKNVEVFGSHCGLGANATVLLSVANALNENIEHKKQKGVISKIESVFYPKFWKQKGTLKFTNLFQKT